MNFLFELNHPAHGHLFKNTIRQLSANGHETTVLIKDIPVLKAILDDAGIHYQVLGSKGKGITGKLLKQAGFVFRTYGLHRQKHFDVGIGISVTLPLLSRITSMPAIVCDDDDKKATPYFAWLAHNNAAALLRPQALSHEGNSENTIYYNGYHELAYLHPAVFTADASVLKEQGLQPGETFFIVRLVSLKAHHDKGIKGIGREEMHTLAKTLKPHGRIILTHEAGGEQIPGTEPLRIHPARLHHLMAYAKMIISDGQTMCSEAACLGVPSVRINDFAGRISYLQEQEEKWKLTFGFKPTAFDEAVKKIGFILIENNEMYRHRRNMMLASCINVSGFLSWFIENWPSSLHIMKQNPDYQFNFS
jgi:uncharacterized protein